MKRKYTQEEVWQHMNGRIYINSDDLNIFVKRKFGYSWTMNLGNKWSWVIMAAEAVAVVLIVCLFM